MLIYPHSPICLRTSTGSQAAHSTECLRPAKCSSNDTGLHNTVGPFMIQTLGLGSSTMIFWKSRVKLPLEPRMLPIWMSSSLTHHWKFHSNPFFTFCVTLLKFRQTNKCCLSHCPLLWQVKKSLQIKTTKRHWLDFSRTKSRESKQHFYLTVNHTCLLCERDH